jgi:hypothetical protein
MLEGTDNKEADTVASRAKILQNNSKPAPAKMNGRENWRLYGRRFCP